jgi:hypothetical protein
MSDGSTVQYLVPASLTRRLNAWLRTQGFAAERVEGRGVGAPTRCVIAPGVSVRDDASVSIPEASWLLLTSENTIRHRVETGRIISRTSRRIPVEEVLRLEEAKGGPPDGA